MGAKWRYYFNFERNCNVLIKFVFFFLNKNIKLKKTETESEMGNPTKNFRETNNLAHLRIAN